MSRYTISDIHGCYQSFQALLDQIALSKADTLYLLGDYIHRGPSSVRVVQQIMDMQKQGYQITCLMGNHEELALPELREFSQYPSRAVAASDSFVRELFQLYACIPADILEFVENLDSCVFLQDYLLVHAGINFKSVDPFGDRISMRWIRDWYGDLDKNLLGNRIVVHGHTPISKVMMDEQVARLHEKQYLDIDGGCVFHTTFNSSLEHLGFLCAFDLDRKSLVRQKCIDKPDES